MHFLQGLNDAGYGIGFNEPDGAWWGSLAVYLLTAVGLWPMLTKAGIPGWGAFIPIWNLYLQIKLAGRPGSLLILYLLPFVNIVVAIVVAVGVARAFGRGPFYGFLLHFLLQPIGYLVTGFGSAKYTEIRR